MPKKAFKVQTKATNAFFRQFRAQWTLKNQKSVYILPRYPMGKSGLPERVQEQEGKEENSNQFRALFSCLTSLLKYKLRPEMHFLDNLELSEH